ncbi:MULTISPECIES: hypothetical protein [Bradyrhizobium]|uniref:Uncharacterized protein n=1 Tax=Bradyrhizobium ottawaense TaxID=931866 RepID=A0ABV4FK30_9BRAD|nr:MULTISPECIES: hypothetical protein [Bradyrhizobium]MBR1295027.1 hypothetical protein [Bradyrhizobium ottawaense]WLB44698.1 hypothetical protein QIH93_29810 [Bradyrhizobium ottawaense]WQN81996.1 hypothetical protein U7859_34270 [Bradyrhizobium ottawaense]GMO10587.1 hypothetical protein BwSH20_74160 [Bradyrhizobium ottawaense]GMO53176.1 hypothetical protein BwSH14_76390 [Bradyrhizobium ottawaense]
MTEDESDCGGGDDWMLDDGSEGNEFIHFDEYEDAVAAIELVASHNLSTFRNGRRSGSGLSLPCKTPYRVRW